MKSIGQKLGVFFYLTVKFYFTNIFIYEILAKGPFEILIKKIRDAQGEREAELDNALQREQQQRQIAYLL